MENIQKRFISALYACLLGITSYAQQYVVGDIFTYTDADGIEKEYMVVDENLVENPDFNDGATDWTGGDGNPIGGYELKTGGAVDGGTYLCPGNGGKGANASIGTTWDIEIGKTYLFSFFLKNENDTNAKNPAGDGYIKVSTSNKAREETLVLQPLPHVDEGFAWTQNTWVFTAEHTTLSLCARWLNSSYGFDSFILAEVVENRAAKELEDILAECDTWIETFGSAAVGYSEFTSVVADGYSILDTFDRYKPEEINSILKELAAQLRYFRIVNASSLYPVDFTDYMKNPQFDDGLVDWNPVNVQLYNGLWYRYFAYFNENISRCCEINGAPSMATSISQTISGLPMGLYRFSLQAVMQHDLNPIGNSDTKSGAIISLNGKELDIVTNEITMEGASFENSYPQDFSVESIVGIDSCANIKFAAYPNANFTYVAIDNLKLEYLGQEGLGIGNIGKLTVNFPIDIYKNMYIELSTSVGRVINRYLIGDKQAYTFYGLDNRQAYNVYLKNKSGHILGSIEGVYLADDNTNVAFESLLQPQNITISVLVSDGTDVTAESIVTWYDANGSCLGRDAVLNGQVEDTEVKYSVKLSKELAMQYKQPEQATYMVEPSGNEIKVVLEPFTSVEITGVVRDSISKTPISNAMVTFSQKLNGKYSCITRAATDTKGDFAATIYDVPTEVTVAAADYISHTVSLDTPSETETLKNVYMTLVSGVMVSTEFTYRTSVPDGDTPEILGWYTDYANVKYGILNKTTGLPVSNVSVQYPQLVLLDGVSAGDELLLTVVSRTNSFEPTQTTAIVDSALRCDATFDIVELGGIKASYTSTANSAVVGILYNEIGEMVQKRSYSSASLTLDNLRDGVYTLVTMGSSDYFNSIYNLSQFADVGLVEGTDYVKYAVTVESGVFSVIKVDTIPTLTKLHYTGTDTRFTVNKTSATAGNYLTLTGQIDFMEEYASKVSAVSMVIDIPESAVFVDNSVMVGATIAPYTLEGNRLTISLPGNYTERVRFCIIPTESGSYAPTAFAQFTIDGKEVLQPIGSAHYTIKDLSIEVPGISAKTTIPVSGTAIGQSTIQIYDNDVLIGETTSLANGVWSATCELHEPYNLSKHRIHAKVTTKLGVELTSEAKECMYDMNAVQVSKVTMINVAHPANSLTPCEYVTVFDFLHPAKSIPDYWYWPDYPEFTFLIEFTDNDTTKVSNVVLWVETCNGNQVPLNAEYDESKGLWVASGNFGSWSNYDIPTNVSLDFDCRTDALFDTSELKDMSDELIDMAANCLDLVEIIDSELLKDSNVEIDDVNIYDTQDWALILDSIIDDVAGFDESEDFITSYSYFAGLSDEELDSYIQIIDSIDYEAEQSRIEEDLAVIIQTMSDSISEDIVLEDSTVISLKTCDGITLEILLERGFEEYSSTGGKGLYLLATAESSELVDLDNNRYTVIRYGKQLSSIQKAIARNRSSAQSGLDAFNEVMDNINSLYQPIANAWERTNKDLLNFAKKFEEDYIKHSFDYGRKKSVYNSKLAKLNRLKAELKTLNSTNINYYVKLGEIQNYQKEVKQAKSLMNAAGRLKAVTGAAFKAIKPLPGIFAKNLPLTKYADAIYTFLSVAMKYQQLYLSIPDPCTGDQSDAEALRKDCIDEAIATEVVAGMKLGATALLDFVTFSSIASSAGTAGVSVPVALSAAIANVIINITVDYAFNKQVDKSINDIRKKRNELECIKNCGEPGMPPCPDDPNPNNPDDPSPDDPRPNNPNPNNNNGGEHKSNNPNVGGVHDPSGYVYEGVSSNRLEGVMALCYYKETVEDIYGDQHENIVLWDAEEYAQENPLFTDANGMYRWDVPKGLWQVKFEKEGYETTYSEWLPVPPPQLEVNIPMVQNKQPEVAGVHAYKDGVEIEFDKYMQPATLNTDNIFVTQNDEKVAGTVTLLNEEMAYEDKSETYASKVRFVFDQPITAKEITLTVVNSVKSYAGLQMQDVYTQTFAIEQEVEGIVADSLVSMYYGGEHTLTVKVIPAAAAAGKTLVVTSSSPMILGVDTDSIVLDNSGEAVLTVSGELPGMGAISYSLVGYDYRASTLVEVVYNNTKMTANPTASIASGTTVAKGTEVTLSCTTEGAAIYYTLDGSCPCDDTAILYDGTPIVINENTELRIMAVAEGMYESDVVVYNYYVEGADVEEVTLPFGIDPTVVTDGFRVQGIETECTVAVYGVGGELVLQREHVKNNTFINIAHVPEGMYIVVVSKDDDTHKQRILKVK